MDVCLFVCLFVCAVHKWLEKEFTIDSKGDKVIGQNKKIQGNTVLENVINMQNGVWGVNLE